MPDTKINMRKLIILALALVLTATGFAQEAEFGELQAKVAELEKQVAQGNATVASLQSSVTQLQASVDAALKQNLALKKSANLIPVKATYELNDFEKYKASLTSLTGDATNQTITAEVVFTDTAIINTQLSPSESILIDSEGNEIRVPYDDNSLYTGGVLNNLIVCPPNVPVKVTIVLKNVNLMPSHFKYMKLINKMKFENIAVKWINSENQ